MASDEMDDESFGGKICHAFVFWDIASSSLVAGAGLRNHVFKFT